LNQQQRIAGSEEVLPHRAVQILAENNIPQTAMTFISALLQQVSFDFEETNK
jgi:hypothetical protein